MVFFYSPRFSVINASELTLVGKSEQLLRMLEIGRIDVVVTSASHNLKLFEDSFEKMTFVDTFDNPLYISIPKNSRAEKFYKDIADLMLEYRKSGKIESYFERYGISVPKQVFE
ncbi:transporter substrate-binding domain-containing protein [Colwellia hornerae]|uniref:transporter substrate-binding domain-containing protein n=1 Tax=Colwellia hornerae TaxID=89402 RepID=UPI001CB9608E|nr:transporter substrate-binding domain-containing protein [Colwellia hornerae]